MMYGFTLRIMAVFIDIDFIDFIEQGLKLVDLECAQTLSEVNG